MAIFSNYYYYYYYFFFFFMPSKISNISALALLCMYKIPIPHISCIEIDSITAKREIKSALCLDI